MLNIMTVDYYKLHQIVHVDVLGDLVSQMLRGREKETLIGSYNEQIAMCQLNIFALDTGSGGLL